MSTSFVHGADLRALLAERLAGFPATDDGDNSGLKRAAVAITIVSVAPEPQSDELQSEDVEAGFLLTRRTPKLRAHSGQFALPGGRVDAGETLEQAALRELHEEIGIELSDQAVLGRLDTYPTRSGYLITPIVVWAPPDAVPRPNPAEVAHLYRVPLADLRRTDSPVIFSIPESDRPLIRLPISLLNTQINAPTAAVLYQFREVALEGRATRVNHFDQPVFAWR